MVDDTACRQCGEYVEILFNATARYEKAERERDEARAQLAEWRELAGEIVERVDNCNWPARLQTEYDRLVMAGPLPEPEETP